MTPQFYININMESLEMVHVMIEHILYDRLTVHYHSSYIDAQSVL